jgi:hypothetical protein
MSNKKFMRSIGVLTVSLFLALSLIMFSPVAAKAQNGPLNAPLGIYNIIDRVEIVDGQLVAFDNENNFIPLNLDSLGRQGPPDDRGRPPGPPGQGQGSPQACPILNLELGAITLNLLGLLVETSDICLEITAHPSQGLLGDLLCSIARLLDRGISLEDILAGLTQAEQDLLTDALRDIINGALNNLNDAIITGYDLNGNGNNFNALQNGNNGCVILFLELGPLDLNILGLRVYLHDCKDEAITIKITAIPSGGLLGDLLCALLGGLPNLGDFLEGLIGSTLQDLLNLLLELDLQELDLLQEAA